MARPREFDTDKALDRAVDTFWQQGFEGSGVQALCAAMKLNPGSVYAAFGDKRALYLAAMDRYIDTVSREAIERINGAASGGAGIRTYFANLIEAIIGGKRRWGCLVTNAVAELAQRDPEIANKIDLHFARLTAAFEAALARASLDGELVPGAGQEKAPFLVCVVQGLNVLAKTRPPKKILEGIVRTALDAVLKSSDRRL